MAEPILKGQKMSELDSRLRQVILGAEDESFPSDIPLFNFTVPTKPKSQANNALSVLISGPPTKFPAKASIVSKPEVLVPTPNLGAHQKQHKQCWTPESTKPKVKDKSQAFCMPKLPAALIRFREDSEFKNFVKDSPVSKRRTSIVFLAGFLTGCFTVVFALMFVIALATSGIRDPDDLPGNSFVGPVTTQPPGPFNTLEPQAEHRRAPANAGNFDEELLDSSKKAAATPSTVHSVTTVVPSTNVLQNEARGAISSRATTTKIDITGADTTTTEPNMALHEKRPATTEPNIQSSRASVAFDHDQTPGSPGKAANSFLTTNPTSSVPSIFGRTRADQLTTTASDFKKSNSGTTATIEPEATSSKHASEITTKASTRQEKNSLTRTPIPEVRIRSESTSKQTNTTKGSWQKQSVSIISGIIYQGKKHNDSTGKESTTEEAAEIQDSQNANLKATSTLPAQIEQPESETPGNRRSLRNIDQSSAGGSDKQMGGEKSGGASATQNPKSVPKKKSSWFTRFILAVKQTLKKINLI